MSTFPNTRGDDGKYLPGVRLIPTDPTSNEPELTIVGIQYGRNIRGSLYPIGYRVIRGDGPLSVVDLQTAHTFYRPDRARQL